jgi:hypothetical protein
MKSLAHCLGRVLALLLKLQPRVGEYAVVGAGPYYIPRSGEWHPSTFMLYRGKLFASLYIAPRWHGLSWLVGSDSVEVEHGSSLSTSDLNHQHWRQALEQIERRPRTRPGALSAIRWDPIPTAAPIAPDQMARIEQLRGVS